MPLKHLYTISSNSNVILPLMGSQWNEMRRGLAWTWRPAKHSSLAVMFCTLWSLANKCFGRLLLYWWKKGNINPDYQCEVTLPGIVTVRSHHGIYDIMTFIHPPFRRYRYPNEMSRYLCNVHQTLPSPWRGLTQIAAVIVNRTWDLCTWHPLLPVDRGKVDPKLAQDFLHTGKTDIAGTQDL